MGTSVPIIGDEGALGHVPLVALPEGHGHAVGVRMAGEAPV